MEAFCRLALIQSLPLVRYEYHKATNGKPGKKKKKYDFQTAATEVVAPKDIVAGEDTPSAVLGQHACRGQVDTTDEKAMLRECCICMSEFKVRNRIRILPCMHYFHSKCIDKWLLHNLTCPICMLNLVDLAATDPSCVNRLPDY